MAYWKYQCQYSNIFLNWINIFLRCRQEDGERQPCGHDTGILDGLGFSRHSRVARGVNTPQTGYLMTCHFDPRSGFLADICRFPPAASSRDTGSSQVWLWEIRVWSFTCPTIRGELLGGSVVGEGVAMTIYGTRQNDLPAGSGIRVDDERAQEIDGGIRGPSVWYGDNGQQGAILAAVTT